MMISAILVVLLPAVLFAQECPLKYDDVQSRALHAPLVAHAQALVATPSGGLTYNVTINLLRMYKGSMSDWGATLVITGPLSNDAQLQKTRCLGSAEMQKKYIFFAAPTQQGGFFSTMYAPVEATPENLRSVEMIICRDCTARPEIVSPLSDITRNEGTSLSAMCVTRASPSAVIEWYKDGVLLTNKSVGGFLITRLNDTTLELQIQALTVPDHSQGWYTCKARNLLGETDKSFRIIVVPKTPALTTTNPMAKLVRCPASKEGHCLNGGTCYLQISPSGNETLCSCAHMYNGPRCEIFDKKLFVEAHNALIQQTVHDMNSRFVLYAIVLIIVVVCLAVILVICCVFLMRRRQKDQEKHSMAWRNHGKEAAQNIPQKINVPVRSVGVNTVSTGEIPTGPRSTTRPSRAAETNSDAGDYDNVNMGRHDPRVLGFEPDSAEIPMNGYRGYQGYQTLPPANKMPSMPNNEASEYPTFPARGTTGPNPARPRYASDPNGPAPFYPDSTRGLTVASEHDALLNELIERGNNPGEGDAGTNL